MTICTFNDTYWNSDTLGAPPALQPWLRDRGSLTKRIQLRCDEFSVRNVSCSLSRIAQDESAVLDIANQRLAWSREVFLCANGTPVVFAHSACPAKHLNGAWHRLRDLGNRPLGALLFADPKIARQPLRYKALHAHHPLYRRATDGLSAPPERLWARRSLFYLYNAPLLVTEVFLPEIFHLKK